LPPPLPWWAKLFRPCRGWKLQKIPDISKKGEVYGIPHIEFAEIMLDSL
jgi:hypothetical protein